MRIYTKITDSEISFSIQPNSPEENEAIKKMNISELKTEITKHNAFNHGTEFWIEIKTKLDGKN